MSLSLEDISLVYHLLVKFACLVVKMEHLVVILNDLVVKITSLVVIVKLWSKEQKVLLKKWLLATAKSTNPVLNHVF